MVQIREVGSSLQMMRSRPPIESIGKKKGCWEKWEHEEEEEEEEEEEGFHAWLLFRLLLTTLLYCHPLQFLGQDFEQDFAAGSADIAHASRDKA
jgi:hypothetical protein